MKPRAISFDLFDTLVDIYMENLPEVEVDGKRVRYTLPALHAELERFAPIAFAEFARTLGEVDGELRAALAPGRELPTLERFSALARRLGVGDPELPRALTRAHMGALVGQVEPLAHHPRVLERLAAEHRLAVCSNFTHAETAREVLAGAGLLDHFHAVAISEEVGWRKPRAEIFRACLDALGCEPGETLHVGDNLKADVAGAAALGLRTAWITRRVRDPEAALEAFDGPRPDLVVSDLAELVERLR